MDSYEKEEIVLQQQLKRLCSKRGRELDLTKSAEIFNKLGLLYKTRSPDKISLIQSSALLNAAIVRQPGNQKFQDDLHDLCKHVVDCANAEENLANLVSIAKSVKSQITEMRNNVRTTLKNMKEISKSVEENKRNLMECTYIVTIESLQLSITDNYSQIMRFISQKCIQIMGSPPCKYTLVGLGSLARKEITPFSDFEHVILLPNLHQKTNSNESSFMKEYFRWYSVLFHIIVINLQETIIPSVAIACLNDTVTPGGDWFWDTYTTQGISFDSLKPLASKVPLGRTQKTPNKPWTTELIKSVDEMVKYLDADEDLKNGYKLADILTRTCYVDGDETIYDEFCQKVKSTLKQNQSYFSNMKKELDEDLANFDVVRNFGLFVTTTNINIKRIIYRSITLFISALGRMHDVDEHSCFNIIDRLHRRQEINDLSAHRLSHAVAVACHVRLFQYMSKQRQDDTIDKEYEVLGVKEKFTELTKAVHKCCLVKCLATGYVLQAVIQCNLAITQVDDSFGMLDFTARMGFFALLCLHREGISYGEKRTESINRTNWTKSDIGGYIHLCHMYTTTGQYNKSLGLSSIIKKHEVQAGISQENVNSLMFNDMLCFLFLRRYSEALKVIDSLLKTDMKPDGVFVCLLNKGEICTQMRKHREALSTLRDAKRCVVDSVRLNSLFLQTSIKFQISLNLIGSGQMRQGLHEAKEGLNLAINNNFVKFACMLAALLNKLKHPNVQRKLDSSFETAWNETTQTLSAIKLHQKGLIDLLSPQ